MDSRKSRLLCDAAWDGHTKRVHQLLQDSDVMACSDVNTALLHACHRGHVEVVLALLGGTDANPRARNSEALWRAARHRRGRVVRLMAPLSDVSRWEDWQWDELPAAMQARLGRSGL
ncbi:hypothetical protein ABIE56_000271 [Luteibacter sp. 621]|uniref:ankyrin repeat domain-containing protein n=1 Tax=Luteibacter sp. 621 TaxID=3373916 RepID=UPI003D1BE9A7